MLTKIAKKELEKLAEDLYDIGEVEMTKDVYRIIATIKEENIEKVASPKEIRTTKEIEKTAKDLKNLFR